MRYSRLFQMDIVEEIYRRCETNQYGHFVVNQDVVDNVLKEKNINISYENLFGWMDRSGWRAAIKITRERYIRKENPHD